MQKRFRDLLRSGGVGVLLVVLVSLAACAEETAPPAELVRPVRFEPATVAGGVRERSFSGVAEATTMWNGSFKVPGTVERIDVGVGDSVAQGDVVAQIDAYDYELELQQAQSALSQARANARNAQANFERIKELYEDENATRSDFDSALAADRSASEGVSSAESSVELATRRREYTTLRAPFAGSIAEKPIDENENVTAGQVVVRMTVGERRQVSIAIPEAYILEVRRGDPVAVNFDALPGREFRATVSEVGVSSVGMATTFPVTVILDDELPGVRAGMAANVTFRFAEDDVSDYVSVPLAAVLGDGAGNYVFTLVAADSGMFTARRTSVVVGDQLAADSDGSRVRVEVVSGLNVGDRVVTAGAKRIVDGETVRLEGS